MPRGRNGPGEGCLSQLQRPRFRSYRAVTIDGYFRGLQGNVNGLFQARAPGSGRSMDITNLEHDRTRTVWRSFDLLFVIVFAVRETSCDESENPGYYQDIRSIATRVFGLLRIEKGIREFCRARGCTATGEEQYKLIALAGAVEGDPFVPTVVQRSGWIDKEIENYNDPLSYYPIIASWLPR